MATPWTWQGSEPDDLKKINESIQELSGGDTPGEGVYLMVCPFSTTTNKREPAVCIMRPEVLDLGELALMQILGPGVWHLQARAGRKVGAILRVAYAGEARRIQWDHPMVMQGEPQNIPAPWGDLPAKGKPATPAATAPGMPAEMVAWMQQMGMMQQVMQNLTPKAPDPMAQLVGLLQVTKALQPPPPPTFLDKHGATMLTVGGGLLTAAIGGVGGIAAAFAPQLGQLIGLKAEASKLEKFGELAGKFGEGVARWLYPPEEDDTSEGGDEDADADPPSTGAASGGA